MEYDQGIDENLFPDYSSEVAKFFNVDSNTCTGIMKLGDLETGAKLNINFKTMAYSANQYQYSDPYLVYDMVVEINNHGTISTVHAIKAEEVLKAKRPFIPLY